MSVATKLARVKKRYTDLYIKINSNVIELFTSPPHPKQFNNNNKGISPLD